MNYKLSVSCSVFLPCLHTLVLHSHTNAHAQLITDKLIDLNRLPCSFLLLFSSFLLLVQFPKTILFCDNLSVTQEDIFLTLVDASCYTLCLCTSQHFS